MRRAAILYAAVIGAALILAVLVPYLVHSRGGNSVAGWEGLVSPGPLSAAHRMAGAACESCHTPHKGVEAKGCIACHASSGFADRQSAQFHIAARECTSCHVEHDGGRSLVVMRHEALLKPGLWKIPEKSGVDGLKQQARVNRRDAHGSNDLAQLDCASCHSNRDRHLGLFGPTCSSCHGVETWTVAESRHPSPSSTECAQCHKAPLSHYMEHFRMVSQRAAGRRARVEQCFACHTTDNWNNIRGRGLYDHH